MPTAAFPGTRSGKYGKLSFFQGLILLKNLSAFSTCQWLQIVVFLFCPEFVVVMCGSLLVHKRSRTFFKSMSF